MLVLDNQKQVSSADKTRAALIAAAMKLFGRNGFGATSTRMIASAAGANIASIAYHFDSKEGLRLACGRSVVDQMQGFASAAVGSIGTDMDPRTAHAILDSVIDRVALFLIADPKARDIVAFVLREISDPGDALDLIYRELFGPVHASLCAIFATATGGEAESEETRLAVFALLGQMLYFRIGQPVVKRRMGWETIGADEVDAIKSVLKTNLKAMIAARKTVRP